MAYTKLNNIQALSINDKNRMDMKSAVMLFMRDACEELRFDSEKEEEEKAKENFLGCSKKPGDIPFNMQMDIDRLCMEVALERFLETGTAENAFDVYFCYLEMYVGNYSKTKGMIEMLSEYEENGAALLGKHRDHYSHSVYVFSLGLAIYQNIISFRNIYNAFYGIEKKKAAAHFLKYWGLAALFHDIGYPFELPYEQIVSYFENEEIHDRNKMPFMAYKKMERYVNLSKKNRKKITEIIGYENGVKVSIEEVIAFDICQKLGQEYCISENELVSKLSSKPTKPDEYGGFMDHAYFSAIVLFEKLFEEIEERKDLDLDRNVIDVLSAIVMHNSLYKHCIAEDNSGNCIPLKADLHPVAWLLMLCDELQCWDRFSYGKNTRKELYPMQAMVCLKNNQITVKYCFDEEERFKEEDYKKKNQIWKRKPIKEYKPRLKMYSDLVVERKNQQSAFVRDIKKVVDIAGINLSTSVDWISRNYFSKDGYVSSSSFRHLYYFAVALNSRYNYCQEWDKKGTVFRKNEYLESNKKKFFDEFEHLSLEYKLSNINQAKSFGKYLDRIKCFYTDRDVDYRMLGEFSKTELSIIGSMEHERWLNEHLRMGWKYGNASPEDRELSRLHIDMIPDAKIRGGRISHSNAKKHYEGLPQSEKDKDIKPMKMLVAITRLFDGVKIYRYT